MAKWIVLLFVALISIGTPAYAGNGFSFTFQKQDGSPLKLDEFEGKALLVVNTATECGFSYQFEHLEQVWQDRKDEGLVVVGVASNDFGGQEPRSGKTLGNYCTRKYGITFPMTDRTPVTGTDAHPFYKWAAAAEASSAPRWNFHKYIVGRDGEVVASFPSSVDLSFSANGLSYNGGVEAACEITLRSTFDSPRLVSSPSQRRPTSSRRSVSSNRAISSGLTSNMVWMTVFRGRGGC